MIVFYLLILIDYLFGQPRRYVDPPAKPVALAKKFRRVLLSDREVIPITMFFGDGWTEPHWRDGAVSCTAGPTKSGRYYAIRLADFEPATKH